MTDDRTARAKVAWQRNWQNAYNISRQISDAILDKDFTKYNCWSCAGEMEHYATELAKIRDRLLNNG